MSRMTLYINHGDFNYFPVVKSPVTYTTERCGVSKLEFSCYIDSELQMSEGDAVVFAYDGTNVFLGFIFSFTQTQDEFIDVVAYDQLRYLKFKDTLRYVGWSASNLLNYICNLQGLNTGTIEDTGYAIPKRIEKNKTYMDMILGAMTETTTYTHELYVLYDDFGKICLKNICNNTISTGITAQVTQGFEYKSSIDSETYNYVKIDYIDMNTSEEKFYVAKDDSNINRWGLLQYYEYVDNTKIDSVKIRAEQLLKYYNDKTTSLNFTGVISDATVKANVLIPVIFDLFDLKISNYMIVDKCTSKFTDEIVTSDLTVIGAGINSGGVDTSGSMGDSEEESK